MDANSQFFDVFILSDYDDGGVTKEASANFAFGFRTSSNLSLYKLPTGLSNTGCYFYANEGETVGSTPPPLQWIEVEILCDLVSNYTAVYQDGRLAVDGVITDAAEKICGIKEIQIGPRKTSGAVLGPATVLVDDIQVFTMTPVQALQNAGGKLKRFLKGRLSDNMCFV